LTEIAVTVAKRVGDKKAKGPKSTVAGSVLSVKSRVNLRREG
jgi:hypothetical protein